MPGTAARTTSVGDALVAGRADRNLTSIVWDRADAEPDHVMLRRRTDGRWNPVTAAQFRSEVLSVARGLVGSGLQPGERVAIMCRTRYEWAVFDFAIWAAGAVSVPVYETSSPEQVRFILKDSGAAVLVVENPEHATLWTSIADDVPGVREMWQIEPASAEGGIEDLVALGARVSEGEVEKRRAGVLASDLATVIYTSGTMGRPKGCELTHAHFLAEVDGVLQWLHEIFEDPEGAALLFLPLAHVFARLIQLAVLAAGVQLGHTPDVKNLLADLVSFRPTFLLAVPRVFEKVYNAAEQKADLGGKGRIFRAAASTATAYSAATAAPGAQAGALLRARHTVFDHLVYAKLREALGGRVRFAVCGGAPINAWLVHFFRGVGLTVLEGYGLTETTAAATVNTPSDTHVGTVGRPLPGLTVRIAEDGEIQLKGPQVFARYLDNPEATGDAFTPDGFFRTGDIGELDDDGYLKVTGRSKELIVTAAGKNVAPAALEYRVRAATLVSQCLVVGDAKPFVAALVTLDMEAVAVWLETRKRPPLTRAEAARDPQVHLGVQAAVDAANREVSRPESIRRFRILDVDLTEQSGHLTPSLKLKRTKVLEDFADEVAALYA